MGRKSTIEQLPEDLRLVIDKAIKDGWTIDRIVAAVKGTVSRAAVGRYSKNFAAVAKRQRDIAAAAEAWGAEFGQADNPQTRMLVQLATTVLTRAILPALGADADDFEQDDPDWKELHFMARAIKDLLAAHKLDAEREASIRKNEREKAVAVVAAVGKRAGATPETIDQIKRELLGMT